jgi:hypothetical protein
MARLGTTWNLMGESWAVLKKDKELLLFPVLSGVTCTLVLATFVIPLVAGGYAESRLGSVGKLAGAAISFAYYFVNYTVMIFFNSAIIGCAVKRLQGGNPTLGDGFRIAFRRLPQILGWAALSATVGLLLRALESHRLVGKIVALILGVAWAMMSFFAVPILVVEGKGPFDALSESSALLKRTWGTQARGSFGFGLIFLLFALPLVGLVVLGVASHNPTLALVCVAIAGIGFVMMAVVYSALFAIFQSALFLHARGEARIEGFDHDLLQGAIASQ